jgi:hypothetical protein
MLMTLAAAAFALLSIAAGLAMVTKNARWCRLLGVSRSADRPVLPELTLFMGFLVAAAVVYRVLTEPNALS